MSHEQPHTDPAPAADQDVGGPVEPAPTAPVLDPVGIRPLILGAVVAVLGPLAGFLGGSMNGSSLTDQPDPLFVWLFSGLVVGGIGAVVAFVGGLRWWRTNRGRL